MGRKKGGGKDDPRWRSDLEPAPGELRIVQALVNTTGTGNRHERLPSSGALAEWLASWGLLSPGTELLPADLERARKVRSGLEALVGANHGPAPAAEVTEWLDRAAAAAPIVVRVGADGSGRFEPAADGLAEALARLFKIFAIAHDNGLWRRLKLCDREDCRAAFYDFSNGITARWCSARCGGRGASRTYRDRRKRYRAKKLRDRPLTK